MWTPFCLTLLILLPLSLQNSITIRATGTQPGDCRYSAVILEIKKHLNTSSENRSQEQSLVLMGGFLKSNLAVFLNASEFLNNTSASSIKKNLKYLQKILQPLPLPTPAPQEEEWQHNLQDFNEFSGKLNIFLKTLNHFLKSLLNC